jgi:hypothetical protein
MYVDSGDTFEYNSYIEVYVNENGILGCRINNPAKIMKTDSIKSIIDNATVQDIVRDSVNDRTLWNLPTGRTINLFKVDEIYGLNMAGVWSNCGYVDFKGTLIAELDRSGGTTIECNDVDDVSIIKTNKLITNFAGKSYVEHNTQEYNTFGFRLDFSDYYKAGMEGQINDYSDNKASILNMGIAETMTLNLVYEDIYGQSRILNLPMNTSTAYWLSDGKRIGKTPVLGFGQQGGSMGFTQKFRIVPKLLQLQFRQVPLRQ